MKCLTRLQNPKFLTPSPEQCVTVDLPLLTIRPLDDADNQPVDIASPVKSIGPVDKVNPVSRDVNREPSPKKKRTVQFAL